MKKEDELKKAYKKRAKVFMRLKPRFDSIIKKIARDNSCLAVVVPLKTEETTVQKAIVDYSGNINKVKDILRGAIIVPAYDLLDVVLEDVKTQFNVVRIKNRFKSPGKDLYRDILINIKIRNEISEIQIHIEELYNTKEYVNHLFYELKRRISVEANKNDRPYLSWEVQVLNDLLEVEKYSNKQAWIRQNSFEDGKDLSKILFMVTHSNKKFQESKLFIPTLKLINVNLPEVESKKHSSVVKEKVKSALKFIDANLIVEDVALYCEGLIGLPGQLDLSYPLYKNHKRLEKQAVPSAFAKLVISTGNTKASFVSTIGFVDHKKKIHIFKGVTEGKIVLPRGKNNFILDSIFQPNGCNKTYAEMSTIEKKKYSMRRESFQKLIKYLHKNYDFPL